MLPCSPISILNKNSGTQNRSAKFIMCTKSLGSMENVRCMHHDNCIVEERICTAQLGRVNITNIYIFFLIVTLARHTIYRLNNGEKKLLLEKGSLKWGTHLRLRIFLSNTDTQKQMIDRKLKASGY